MNPEFVRLLESLANGVVIADSAGTIIFANHFLEQIFGYRPGELLGLRVEALLPAEMGSLHTRHRAQYNTLPETRVMGAGRDLLARRKDGSVFPVEIGLSPIATPEGTQVVAIVTDITKRKHAEQRSSLQRDVALILSNADSIESAAPNLMEAIGRTLGWKLGALWLVDAEGGEMRNAAFWRAPGAEAPELEVASRRLTFRKGEGFLGHVWQTGQPQWVSSLAAVEGFLRVEEAQHAGLHSAFELPILVGAQTLGILEFFFHEIRPSGEAVIEIAVAVSSQIGQFMERKRSERALGIFEKRYRSLFENAVFGIFRSRISGEILDVNPAMAAMLEYDDIREVLGLNLNRDVYRNVQDRERLIEESRIANRFDGYEVDWKTKTGGTIHVRLSGRAVRNEDGSLAGLEAIAENITQRRSLEQQFRQAQKMEAVGRLAGGVAHDFNNLLTIISVSTDALLDQLTANEGLRQTAEEVVRATEQGASLVRQLMAFSRTQPQTLQTVDLNDVIRASQRMLGILAGEDIELEFHLDAGECHVLMESIKIEQILMNLVANSRDAMPEGGVLAVATAVIGIDEELASLYVGLKPGEHVTLRVSDTGHGMAAEIQSRIFEPFFSTKEEGKGTGLGLSTVYGIVRQHDGHIICASVVGEGTTFTVFLPAASPDAVPSRTLHAPSAVSRGSESILLVEDQPALRTSVRRILEQSGYSVAVAADGREALKISEDPAHQFDLLLTDIALPQMRGTELAGRLLELHPRMRVLYMSGYNEEKVPGGASNFIPKPFRRDALVRKIREVLDSSN